MGRSQEYRKRDLIDFPEDRKIQIMIYDGLVYMKGAASDVHGAASHLFESETLNTLNANVPSKRLFLLIKQSLNPTRDEARFSGFGSASVK